MRPNFFPKTIGSTPEQEQRAIDETERELKQVIGLMRRLDLPMTSFETVANYYSHNLTGLLALEEDKKHMERGKKIAELRQLQAPQIEKDAAGRVVAVHRRAVGAPQVAPIFGAQPIDPLFMSGYVDSVDMCQSDEELDAELARLRALKP